MSETAERYRTVADTFTRRVEAVGPEQWDDPTPCEGWSVRDIVRHMTETSGYFLGMVGVSLPDGPSVDTDPAGAWAAARDEVLAALEDPDLAATEVESGMGPMTLERMVGMFGVGDVLIHTWDLSRATGQDETLDPDEVRRLHATMAPNDERMRQGTAFGPRVEVPDDADEQTKLLAFTGRTP